MTSRRKMYIGDVDEKETRRLGQAAMKRKKKEGQERENERKRKQGDEEVQEGEVE